jgi:hypothetical protein
MVVLAMSAPACLASVEARPKVKVTFASEAAGVNKDLGAARAEATAAVAATAAQRLAELFPYFDWVTTGAAAHTLTLTLRARQGSLDVEHVLIYTATLRVGADPLHVLYPWDDPPPDPADLKNDLVQRVRNDITASTAELKAYFVAHVPLVTRVDVDKKFVVVPVAGVHAEDAKFLVEFEATAMPGRMRLKDPLEAPNKGIYCSIENFTLPPDFNNAEWGDAVAKVLREQARNVTVKVKEFTPKAHPNTSGGTVTSLTGGVQ